MTENKTELPKPIFTDVNYQLLGFKNPDGFNRKAIGQIYNLLKENAMNDQIFFSMDEFQDLFVKRYQNEGPYDDKQIKRSFLMQNWQNKNIDDLDMDNKLNQGLEQIFKDNLRVLVNNEIIKSITLVEQDDDKLVEKKKYFLNQTNNDLMNYGSNLSADQARQYILKGMDRYRYPFSHVLSKNEIYGEFIQSQYFEANHLLNTMVSDEEIIVIPLISDVYSGVDSYEDCFFPGRCFTQEINDFMDQYLIPALHER
ncbi:MAG TPA: hypothetical protein ENI73_10585, partial [Spirochaetes bacterium]|nr:hypothetical protein [Spirochaetota bacterium]